MKLGQLQELNETIRKLIHPEIPAQQLAILYLVASSEGITQGDIAKALAMPQGTVSRNVLKLASKLVQRPDGRLVESGYGLLVNKEDINEPRRYVVYLTDKGREVIKKLLDVI